MTKRAAFGGVLALVVACAFAACDADLKDLRVEAGVTDARRDGQGGSGGSGGSGGKGGSGGSGGGGGKADAPGGSGGTGGAGGTGGSTSDGGSDAGPASCSNPVSPLSCGPTKKCSLTCSTKDLRCISAGSSAPGATCSFDTDCAAGSTCVRMSGGTLRCMKYCTSDADCAGKTCSVGINCEGDTEPRAKVCAL